MPPLWLEEVTNFLLENRLCGLMGSAFCGFIFFICDFLGKSSLWLEGLAIFSSVGALCFRKCGFHLRGGAWTEPVFIVTRHFTHGKRSMGDVHHRRNAWMRREMLVERCSCESHSFGSMFLQDVPATDLTRHVKCGVTCHLTWPWPDTWLVIWCVTWPVT